MSVTILSKSPFRLLTSKPARPAPPWYDDKAFNSRIGHSVMAMITSAKHSGWPLDTRIENLMAAGLPAPSIIRLKLFTLDNRLILAKLGQLASADQVVVEQHLKTLFCW